ncbi:DUF4232 domain-containing protein [Corynebacterium sp. FDAARGOS 1242]|uniref:DUF4232 domain-containing protein n=1 Tax=Corynebacterium sp. FDAARGOS 1242 TaxID=2778078 RepID=UPI00194EA926|nr:DUF4232 domain-containing protein [Corynebacterium sp. FDAARGOS 1242]QRP97071.1 DUF4232 domain-containing protein [Corynebacterium sp. FDAARGOS 1242]
MTTQRLLPVLAAGSLALVLTGCSTDDSTDAPLSDVSPAPVSPSPSPESHATPQASDDTDAVSTPLASADSPASDASSSKATQEDTAETVPASTEDGACATAQLDISLNNEQGAAGSRLADIVFTNTSNAPCTLTGFPGVSAVTNDDGTQLGAAAERETSLPSATVTLEPGKSARAGLKMTVVDVIDPATCQPQPADGLRVYPPGETASAFVRVEGLQGCAGEANYLSVQPVTAT